MIVVQLYETFRGFETSHFVLREKDTFGQCKISSCLHTKGLFSVLSPVD